MSDGNTDSGELFSAIMRGDRGAASAFLDGLLDDHSLPEVMEKFLEPTLLAIGKEWEKESVSLAQGYIAGKVVEDFLEKASRHYAVEPGRRRPGPIVLANAEDDFHPLGRRLVGTFLRLEGWEVIDLGVDVTASDLVERAVSAGSRVVGVSAMMYSTAKNVAHVRREIDRRDLAGRLQLAVGGAVFSLRPELVAEVGGDGTARNALAAPKLFAELWQKTEGAR
jgi:methanogenic corrinoid protein MtbC1